MSETTIATTEAAFDGFEYLDLNTVDPSNNVPQNMYTLKIRGAQMLPHIGGPNSKNPGAETTKIQLKLIVTEGDYAGRTIPSTIWQSPFAKVSLRKIMDATGVAQQPGEAFVSWLNRLVDTEPDFKALVKVTDRGNDVDYRTAVPNV